MTIAQYQSILDAVDEALLTIGSAPTKEIVQWIRCNRPETISAHAVELEDWALADVVRRRRKMHSVKQVGFQQASLFQDFGLPEMDLDVEISVPRDLENLTYGACDWKDLEEEATIDDIDRHIQWLRAQAAYLTTKAESYTRFRQRIIRFSPGRRTNITVRELRVLARARN